MSSGTIEGSISVLGSKDMRVLVKVKKAHLGIVTTLAFSQDSRSVTVLSFFFSWWIPQMQSLIVVIILYIRTVLSTSFDSSARVTSTGPPKSTGMLYADLQFSICCVLANFWSNPKNGCLFSDRYKPVVHDTSYHYRNFGILLYAAQRRSLSNVAPVNILLSLYWYLTAYLCDYLIFYWR